jgi:peptidoglycan/xylan/chitin deacetylase (PgdA/CDA1 family)
VQNLRLLIVSDAQPRLAWRLAERIVNEVDGASICGIVYQAPKERPKSLKDCLRNWAVRFGDFLLRLAHASPMKGSQRYRFSVDDLVRRGATCGWPVKLCDEVQPRKLSDFIRGLSPDLCVLWTNSAIACELSVISRHGAIALNRVPSGKTDRGIEIHVSHVDKERVTPATLCSVNLPVEPYDTVVSQKLKSDLISMDLLVQSVATMARGNTIQRSLRADDLLPHLRYWRQRTTGYGTADPPALRTRPWWKLCVAPMLLAPYTILRNWYRRWRGRFPVTILFHHMVSDVPHHLGMPTDAFFREVNYLAKHYRIVSLSEATELIRSGKVKEPTLVLTFDDGYQENFITLRAVTEATGIPVTCFVCTQIAERQGELDHDLRKNERNFLSMNWEQIAYLSRNGVEIGSHTRTHFDCGSSDVPTLREEIMGAKVDLEQHIDSVRFFAFPYGKRENMSAEALELAAAEYEYSVSGLGGDNFPDSHRVQRHVLRKGLPQDVWELELTLQSILDLKWMLKRRLGIGREARAEEHFLASISEF